MAVMLSKREKGPGGSIHQREGFFSDLFFVVGCLMSVLLPELLVATVLRLPLLYLSLLFVSWSLACILGFTSYGLKRRSSQQRKTVRILKSQHKEFFEQIRSNVVHLLDKGGADERFIPGSSQ
jgi:hypothetical protein